jgi:hypothetical protein
MGTNVMIEEANKGKLTGCQSAAPEKDVAGDRVRNIIDFESGCRALEKDSLHDERDRVRLVEPDRLSCRLSFDWLELLLAIVLLVASLLPLVDGLIVSAWL